MTPRRFIVAVEGLTDNADTEFRKFLGDAGYWHWIGNFWLVITRGDKLSAQIIADKLSELKSGRCLVMEIQEDLDWAAAGRPNSKGKNMFEWLKTVWANKQSDDDSSA